MPVRVETDTAIYVPGVTPGTEDERADLRLTVADLEGEVDIHTGKYGSQVGIEDLCDAVTRAERIQAGDGRPVGARVAVELSIEEAEALLKRLGIDPMSAAECDAAQNGRERIERAVAVERGSGGSAEQLDEAA